MVRLVSSQRQALLVCAVLDLLGLLISLEALAWLEGLTLEGQIGWFVACSCCYIMASWLLGTYSVMGWRSVAGWMLLRRQAFAVFAYLLALSSLEWLLKPPEDVWVVWRSVQGQFLLLISAWSLLMRVALGRSLRSSPQCQMLVVAPAAESKIIMAAWRQTPRALMPRLLPVEKLPSVHGSAMLAISTTYQGISCSPAWLEELEINDPRKFVLTTPLDMAECQLERLPTALIPEPWLRFEAIPWNHTLGVQRQLKRFADVVVAAGLLLLTSPLLLMAGLLIWLEDRGPVLYRQCRTGWLGETFTLIKFRTMAEAPAHAPVVWTLSGDKRITRVGWWLRRTRLDELPQLLQVLSGQMSLIGPRPERPELEQQLEAAIPHYRKRHWMQPGLSGWAQVCAPYAASLKESELKVSYDLYYIKNFSTWLDLLIFFRTIKTLLKVSGQ